METSLYELDDLEFQVQLETNGDDGSYTMYIIPGEYDLVFSTCTNRNNNK